MLRGSFKLIGDKSISHRSIMFSSIAKGSTKISNFLMGQDCLSTINCFRKMGVDIDIDQNNVIVKGRGLRGLKRPSDILDVGNSGTTIRLMMGILAGNEFESTIVGDDSIGRRPMKRVTDPLRLMGCEIEGKDDANYTPITIKGGNLTGIDYKMPVASAQVKSSIILASLYANSPSTIIEKAKSRNHTEIMLNSFGADIKSNDLNINITPIDELYSIGDISVPGDISSAAFIVVAASIVKGSEVTILNVGLNETRTGILDVLKNMNGNFEVFNRRLVGGELVGDIVVRYSEDLASTTIDSDLIPRLIDEIPVIAVLATQANGDTIIKDAKELKVKESNRIQAVVDNLKRMGADIEELEDGMIIKGKRKLKGAKISTFNDHRIAMAFSIAGLICESDVELDNTMCIDISFPGYFELLNYLIK
ncbi:3-phosphoshikimate 1-carboxyvinyltransferase,3-phosphoshikimate 1-carboxyvinyltransferase 1,bifunctional cyclohexadienyl dehydrogenase/ 3-phosphoshikimate 1-carboxyvinyltransferase,5-enolpyruvylshikimate-3-phosphate synthase,3-phosphoshikimate 1-carboxyvinyltransferase,EPSP synthase (3-phosphoshikimate 1-carboxyvinyltransferase) [[Clostridium] sordellii]|uniref:3-phosphoshikimate 1-carboxyvinyltransferase n=1 Tax=Paraclostridium sordellii TaxID=1505 RepID=UPI00054368C0|nr:3-phosphoshikimate 1-carboxyvinyltransferase [Paeniclostridium sordellii]CEK35575.1 3-phosphoshikimate 1-carboxyvinyltransferase,3-phosphoshikimate 1-carboxyvinyltransferase 1,bifunctional cyclohexadienyl dehydrogenase/ 3-phosphoshikimate 1-carboxyvinyltransferase,5-enolpyruvylshikimate-3-phosphate synthase,3-phosphoshikimate 1-carboxyvinyltransferase,EPSP synthase (3-phosphoshikimate 1-carboxyvinyltransferase) [[Clostridium] sordellii] [Paeniclostridium sordellii]